MSEEQKQETSTPVEAKEQVKQEQPKTKVKSEVVLEGVQSFF